MKFNDYIGVIADTLSEGIIIVDDEQCIFYINNSAKELLGAARSKFFKVKLEKLISAKNQELHDIIINSCNDGTNACEKEMSYYRKGKEIRLLASTIATDNIGSLGGRFITIILRDITRFWKLHTSERELSKQLRENYTDHIDGLRQIAESIAHEVRNPIVSIGGYANLLLKKCEESGGPKHIKKYLMYIKKDVQRLDSLVTKAEDYTNIDEVNLRKENIVLLFKKLFEYSSALSDKHKVKLTTPQLNIEEYRIFLDKKKLRKAFQILLKNSILLSSGKHPIKIGVSFTRYEVEMSIDLYSNKIKKEDIHFIFNPFFSITRQETDFNMAYPQRIAILHGGIVKCSMKGNNINLVLSLPREKRNRPR